MFYFYVCISVSTQRAQPPPAGQLDLWHQWLTALSFVPHRPGTPAPLFPTHTTSTVADDPKQLKHVTTTFHYCYATPRSNTPYPEPNGAIAHWLQQQFEQQYVRGQCGIGAHSSAFSLNLTTEIKSAGITHCYFPQLQHSLMFLFCIQKSIF